MLQPQSSPLHQKRQYYIGVHEKGVPGLDEAAGAFGAMRGMLDLGGAAPLEPAPNSKLPRAPKAS